jgi:hypothetical protein
VLGRRSGHHPYLEQTEASAERAFSSAARAALPEEQAPPRPEELGVRGGDGERRVEGLGYGMASAYRRASRRLRPR